MTYMVSITSQGQISIPIRFQRDLGLNKYKKAIISEEDGRLVIEPVKDFLSLGGSLKTNKKPLSNQELHEFVAKAMAEDINKKFK